MEKHQIIREFSSSDLRNQEQKLVLPNFDVSSAIEIGDIAKSLATSRSLPILIEVRLGDWIIYHVSLPGSTPENDRWISRKARTVILKHHSTMFERVLAEEQGIDWHKENNLLVRPMQSMVAACP